jgi:hypothetical protein
VAGLTEDVRTVGAGRKPLVLAVMLAGSCMAVLDVAIVNVAIPSIRDDLDVGFVAGWEAFLRHLGGLLHDKEH